MSEPSVTSLVAALEAELKRYRKALKAIANDNYTTTPDRARGIAQSALKESKR